MREIYKNLLIISSVAAITSASTLASAAGCADLRGTWQNYGYVTSIGAPTEAYSCTFTTASDGSLEEGSYCRTYDLATGEITSPDKDPGVGPYGAGGQYLAANDENGLCRITGQLLIGSVPITIIEATMNRSGDMIRGIEYFDFYGSGVKTVTLYRID